MDLTLRLADNLDAELRVDLADDLRTALLALDGVEDVAPLGAGVGPTGAKGGDLVAWGSLVVSLSSVLSLRVLVEAVASWLRRQPRDVVVEVDGATLHGPVTAAERELLVEAMASRLRAAHPELAATGPESPRDPE